jgi:type I restriction enzyme S subunit
LYLNYNFSHFKNQGMYKKIGDYIRLVDERNKDLEVNTFLGLSISKIFIPSVANTVGTNMANYKIIRKNQFACSTMQVRRDKKMPVALLQDFDEAIISQAYPVFEVIDEDVLLPEYLMMWFSRAEFDREACFHAVGGVRGSLEWEDFCEMEFPLPDIEKQRETVAEYNAVVDRIGLNEKMCAKLEETAQAVYKEWFVDFEFPAPQPPKGGASKSPLGDLGAKKGYKSAGGKMVFCEELGKDVPEGWEVKSFIDIAKLSGGGTPKTEEETYWNGDIPFFTPKDVSSSYYCISTEKNITKKGLEKCSSKLYSQNITFVTARGTVGAVALSGSEMAMNQSCYAILGEFPFFTHQMTIETIKELKNEAVGAVFKALVTKDFEGKKVLNPREEVKEKFEKTVSDIYKNLLSKTKQTQSLQKLKSLLLARMAGNF